MVGSHVRLQVEEEEVEELGQWVGDARLDDAEMRLGLVLAARCAPKGLAVNMSVASLSMAGKGLACAASVLALPEKRASRLTVHTPALVHTLVQVVA